MKGSITVRISDGIPDQLGYLVRLPVDAANRASVIGCQNPIQKTFISALLDQVTEAQVKKACEAVAAAHTTAASST